ncbi:MAG: hypothetical protein GY835_00840 [bacterium]|nr:hypothetical protein [bacterium]
MSLPSNLSEKMLDGYLPVRPVDMQESDYDLLLALAKKIDRRGLSIPAIFFLESSKPLNYIGAQAMVFFGPMVRILFESPNYYRYTELLEDRHVVELLIKMIEGLIEETDKRKRAEKSAAKTVDQTRKGLFRKFWKRNRS